MSGTHTHQKQWDYIRNCWLIQSKDFFFFFLVVVQLYHWSFKSCTLLRHPGQAKSDSLFVTHGRYSQRGNAEAEWRFPPQKIEIYQRFSRFAWSRSAYRFTCLVASNSTFQISPFLVHSSSSPLLMVNGKEVGVGWFWFCVSVCVCVCVCVGGCVGVCVCVCAVSYTHLTLPTRRTV